MSCTFVSLQQLFIDNLLCDSYLPQWESRLGNGASCTKGLLLLQLKRACRHENWLKAWRIVLTKLWHELWTQLNVEIKDWCE